MTLFVAQSNFFCGDPFTVGKSSALFGYGSVPFHTSQYGALGAHTIVPYILKISPPFVQQSKRYPFSQARSIYTQPNVWEQISLCSTEVCSAEWRNNRANHTVLLNIMKHTFGQRTNPAEHVLAKTQKVLGKETKKTHYWAYFLATGNLRGKTRVKHPQKKVRQTSLTRLTLLTFLIGSNWECCRAITVSL